MFRWIGKIDDSMANRLFKLGLLVLGIAFLVLYYFHSQNDNSEDRLTWLGRWRPDRFDPARVKFWSPLRRLKIALGD